MKEKLKGKRKALKIALISLIAFILFFSAGSMIFIKNTYNKNFTRIDKPAFSGYLTYKDVEGYNRREVEFQSGKNALKGYIYGEENDKGLVVIAHGLGFGSENYLPETLYFVDKGWRVFTYDCTGTHESEGENTVGLPQSVIDLNAALTYIEGNSTLKDLPIMLYGHSWGGYAVTAIFNYNYDITAATSISGFSSPMELMFEQAENMMGPFAYVEYPFLWIYQTMLFGKTAGVTAVDGINSTDTAVMIIHGDEDKEISYYGASIIAHKDEITNPNVIYKTCSTENHNGHNSLYESEAASEYKKEKNNEYKEVFDSYNGNIPEDVKAEYYAVIDKFQTSERDAEFMSEVNAFFEKQLK